MATRSSGKRPRMRRRRLPTSSMTLGDLGETSGTTNRQDSAGLRRHGGVVNIAN